MNELIYIDTISENNVKAAIEGRFISVGPVDGGYIVRASESLKYNAGDRLLIDDTAEVPVYDQMRYDPRPQPLTIEAVEAILGPYEAFATTMVALAYCRNETPLEALYAFLGGRNAETEDIVRRLNTLQVEVMA
jgi:hypothetical protein